MHNFDVVYYFDILYRVVVCEFGFTLTVLMKSTKQQARYSTSLPPCCFFFHSVVVRLGSVCCSRYLLVVFGSCRGEVCVSSLFFWWFSVLVSAEHFSGLVFLISAVGQVVFCALGWRSAVCCLQVLVAWVTFSMEASQVRIRICRC